jgi:hypothetical protein
LVPVQEHILTRRARLALDRARQRAAATAAAPPHLAKVNTTDPGSRIMPGKHGGYCQNYNVQALACRRQFILAITLHDNTNDKNALTGLLHTARANLNQAGLPDRMRTALFDNGYASAQNFTTPLPVDRLLIAVTKESDQTTTTNSSPAAVSTAGWQAMADRLAIPANHRLYEERGHIIEPLFAQIFQRFGRTLNHRGAGVETEIFLWDITHNLLKIQSPSP